MYTYSYTSNLSMRTVAFHNIVFYQFCYFQHYALDRVLEVKGLQMWYTFFRFL